MQANTLIEPLYYNTVEQGFEWVGCDVEFVTPQQVVIHEGRIGRAECPLIRSHEGVDGGWYFEEQVIDLTSYDTRIDILLEVASNELCVLVRSDDPHEAYDGQAFDLLIPILRKENDTWFMAKPERQAYENHGETGQDSSL